MIRALPLAVLLLAACNAPAPDARAREADSAAPEPQAEVPQPPVPPAPADGRRVEDKNDLLEFTYAWPAEAAAIPALAARFEQDLERQRRDAAEGANADKEARGADAPFHGHYFSQVWTLQGDSPRLLSLAAEIGTFTGGAHGNSGYEALLWDRESDREVNFADLFAETKAAIEALRPAFCRTLDGQRAEKRGETLPLQGEGWMVECPELGEQAIAPADTDKDGRFDRLRVLIGPYTAGPYAEGSYEVELPVTDAVKALVKPEFSRAF